MHTFDFDHAVEQGRHFACTLGIDIGDSSNPQKQGAIRKPHAEDLVDSLCIANPRLVQTDLSTNKKQPKRSERSDRLSFAGKATSLLDLLTDRARSNRPDP